MSRLLLASTALFLTAVSGFAGSPPNPAPIVPIVEPVVFPIAHEPISLATDGCANLLCEIACPPPVADRFWGSAEYLFYFLKPASVPIPIATTGPAAGRGILGNPAGPGQVILGNSETDFGLFNGMQFTLGGWLNRDHTTGVEVSAFLLENRVERTNLVGGPNALPVLARPYFDTTIGANNTRLLALPGSFSGSLQTKAEARLWGAEADIVKRLIKREGFTLDALTGFRFLGLDESFTITDSANVLGSGITSFNGTGLLAPAQTSVTDRFDTQSNFYGVPLGLRTNYTSGNFIISLTGKVSLGSMQEVVTLSGSSTLVGPNPLPATVPGGLYNLGSNLGRYTNNTFAVVPEVNVRVGYQLTSHMAVTAGYNFLYIDRVVRPGDQINATLNPTFIPTSPNLGVPFGPRQPTFNLDQSDFWAHGASVGVTLTY